MKWNENIDKEENKVTSPEHANVTTEGTSKELLCESCSSLWPGVVVTTEKFLLNLPPSLKEKGSQKMLRLIDQ